MPAKDRKQHSPGRRSLVKERDIEKSVAQSLEKDIHIGGPEDHPTQTGQVKIRNTLQPFSWKRSKRPGGFSRKQIEADSRIP